MAEAQLQAVQELVLRWAPSHTLQPCFDEHNTACGCLMPLVKSAASLACCTIYYCSASCREAGEGCSQDGSSRCGTKCYRAPQCTVHGCNSKAGLPEFMAAVGKLPMPDKRAVILELPLKSVPQHGVSRKQRGASTGGQWTAGWVYIDVVFVQHDSAGNVESTLGLEMQGTSHAYGYKAARQDSVKQAAAESAGLQLLQIEAKYFEAQGVESRHGQGVSRSRRVRGQNDCRVHERESQLGLIQQALSC